MAYDYSGKYIPDRNTPMTTNDLHSKTQSVLASVDAQTEQYRQSLLKMLEPSTNKNPFTGEETTTPPDEQGFQSIVSQPWNKNYADDPRIQEAMKKLGNSPKPQLDAQATDRVFGQSTMAPKSKYAVQSNNVPSSGMQSQRGQSPQMNPSIPEQPMSQFDFEQAQQKEAFDRSLAPARQNLYNRQQAIPQGNDRSSQLQRMMGGDFSGINTQGDRTAELLKQQRGMAGYGGKTNYEMERGGIRDAANNFDFQQGQAKAKNTYDVGREKQAMQIIDSFDSEVQKAQEGGLNVAEFHPIHQEHAMKLADLGYSMKEIKGLIPDFNTLDGHLGKEKDPLMQENLSLRNESMRKQLGDQKDFKASDVADAIMGGNTGLSLEQIPMKQRLSVYSELTKRRNEYKKSGDTYSFMRSTAGLKPPTEDFMKNTEKLAGTIQKLGQLQEQFNTEEPTKIGGLDLSPLIGAIRSKNPWDKGAKSVKAITQALIPNLARGLYGEVGVLTDNDINNYAKTIAQITDPKEIRDAIMKFTMDSIKKDIDYKAKIQGGSGRDISGMADFYKELQDMAGNIGGAGKQAGGKSKTVTQNGQTYTLNEASGKYE